MQRCLNGECVELRWCVGLAALECDWPAFREWAAMAILRQYRTGHVASEFEKEDPPHVCIASATRLMNTLLEKHYEHLDPIDGMLLVPHCY